MEKYLWSLIALFSENERFRKVRPPQAVAYTVKVLVSKKRHEMDTLLLHTTNRKYHMAYRLVPLPMTLDDHEGHSRVAGVIKCNSTNVSAVHPVLTIYYQNNMTVIKSHRANKCKPFRTTTERFKNSCIP